MNSIEKMAQRKAHKLEDKERTIDIHIEENVDFNGMYLSDHVLQGLKSSGFERPSPIQLAAIPLGRCGLDLVVQAKSGTGKTCVFAVIALEMVNVSAPTTQVLVIAPTREIAVQITQVINAIGSAMLQLRAFTFIGGIHLSEDIAKLNCCHIAVGTPGRLTQLVEQGLLKVDNIRLLVLDEADQLLTGQFAESVVHLASALPLNKQVIGLSATYTEDVAKVAEGLMRSPNHVRLGRDSPALLGVNQFVRLLPYHHQLHRRQQIKLTELQALLATVTFNQCLVFSSSQLRAESICNALRASGWPVSYLTGGQTQSDRLEALEALCSYKCRVLVSTDLSARGLDSEHVNLVVNLDMPRDQATYLHRVGRAGRFGSRGAAITLATEGDEWQAMRAIASLANVRICLLQEGWKSSIASKDVKSMEEMEYLSDDELQMWVEKNSRQVYGKKRDDKAKESMDKGNITKGKDSKLREKNKIKDEESLEDSGKENKDNNSVFKRNSCKSKNFKEPKEFGKMYNQDIMTNKENTKKTKDYQHEVFHLQTVHKKKTAADKKKEEAAQIKEEIYKKVLTLLEGINSKPPTVNISYSDILSECSEKYDSISAADNPKVRVPSVPNTLKPTNAGINALDNHWKIIQEEHEQKAISVDEIWVDNETDIHKGLEALIEGKDAVTVLNHYGNGETECGLSDELTPILVAGESSENLTGNKAATVNGSVISKESECKQNANSEIKKSSESYYSTEISSSDATDYPKPKNKRREKILSKAYSPIQNMHIRNEEQQPESCKYPDKTRLSRGQNQTKVQRKVRHIKKYASFASVDGSHTHAFNDVHGGTYSRQWQYGNQSMYDYPNQTQQQEVNGTNTQKHHSQSNFHKINHNMAHEMNFGNYQDLESNQVPQLNGDYYCHNYANYWQDYSYNAYLKQKAYIESANKFASMMDYVQTMGRMSAWMAQDFHKRNKENSS